MYLCMYVTLLLSLQLLHFSLSLSYTHYCNTNEWFLYFSPGNLFPPSQMFSNSFLAERKKPCLYLRSLTLSHTHTHPSHSEFLTHTRSLSNFTLSLSNFSLSLLSLSVLCPLQPFCFSRFLKGAEDTQVSSSRSRSSSSTGLEPACTTQDTWSRPTTLHVWTECVPFPGLSPWKCTPHRKKKHFNGSEPGSGEGRQSWRNTSFVV